MFTAEYLGATGGVVERIVLGQFARVINADNEAKRLFANVQRRIPAVVGYRVLNNSGTEVARSRMSHA